MSSQVSKATGEEQTSPMELRSCASSSALCEHCRGVLRPDPRSVSAPMFLAFFLSLSVCLCLSICLSFSMSLYLFLSIPPFLPPCHPALLSFSLSLPVFFRLFPLSHLSCLYLSGYPI